MIPIYADKWTNAWQEYWAVTAYTNHARACAAIRELLVETPTDGKPRPPADDDEDEPDCCLPDYRVTKLR